MSLSRIFQLALALSLFAVPASSQGDLNEELIQVSAPLLDEIIALVCDVTAEENADRKILVEENADSFWGIQRAVVARQNEWQNALAALGDRPDPPIYRYKLNQDDEGQWAYVNVLDFTDGRRPTTRERRFTLEVRPENVSEWVNGRRGNAQLPLLGDISFDDQARDAPYDAAMVRRRGEWFLVVWRPVGPNSICMPDIGLETAPIASLIVNRFLVNKFVDNDLPALEHDLTFPVRLMFRDGETVKLEFKLSQDQLPPYLAVTDFLDIEANDGKFALAILDLPLPDPIPLRQLANAHAVLDSPDGPVAMWTDLMIRMPAQDKDQHRYQILARLPEDEKRKDPNEADPIADAVQKILTDTTVDAGDNIENKIIASQKPAEFGQETPRFATIKVDFDVYLFGSNDPVAENLILDRCDARLYKDGSHIGNLNLRETFHESERRLVLDSSNILGQLPLVSEPPLDNMSISLQNALENNDNQPCPFVDKVFNLQLKDVPLGEGEPFVLYQARLPHPNPTVVLAMSFPAQGSVGENLSLPQANQYGYLLSQISKGLGDVYPPTRGWQYLTGYFGAFTLSNGTRFLRLVPLSNKTFVEITRENWGLAKREFERDSFTLDRPNRAAFINEANKNLLDPEDIPKAAAREIIFVNYRKTLEAGTGRNPCQTNEFLDNVSVTLTQFMVIFDIPPFQPDFAIKEVPEAGSGVYVCDAPLRQDLILIDAAFVMQNERHEQLPEVIRKILKKRNP